MSYTTSKTNWAESTTLTPEEMNRIEENIEALKSGNETISGNKEFSGNNTHSGGNSFSGNNEFINNIEAPGIDYGAGAYAIRTYTGSLDGSGNVTFSSGIAESNIMLISAMVKNPTFNLWIESAASRALQMDSSGNITLGFGSSFYSGWNYRITINYLT